MTLKLLVLIGFVALAKGFFDNSYSFLPDEFYPQLLPPAEDYGTPCSEMQLNKAQVSYRRDA